MFIISRAILSRVHSKIKKCFCLQIEWSACVFYCFYSTACYKYKILSNQISGCKTSEYPFVSSTLTFQADG